MNEIDKQNTMTIKSKPHGNKNLIKAILLPKAHEIYKKSRAILKKFHEKYPNGYQRIYATLLFSIDVLPVIISVTPYSGIFFSVLVSVLFFVGFILQGITLKNRYDVAAESNAKVAEGLLNDALNEIEVRKKCELATASLHHEIAHHISRGCNRMLVQGVPPHAQCSEDMEYVANSIEDYLTEFYGYRVCVNIKMMVSSKAVRTIVRGKNNIDNRGGEQNVFDRYREDIDVDQNYSFKMIADKNLSCFIEPDLSLIQTTLEQNKTNSFFCDRENWSDYFMSTAVFAIHGLSSTRLEPYGKCYDIVGFLCIDSENVTDWTASRNCMVYNFGSFCSDLLYDYLIAYKKAHSAQANNMKP